MTASQGKRMVEEYKKLNLRPTEKVTQVRVNGNKFMFRITDTMFNTDSWCESGSRDWVKEGFFHPLFNISNFAGRRCYNG